MTTRRFLFGVVAASLTIRGLTGGAIAAEPLRIGIIGCDTSHVPTFAGTFNKPNAGPEFADMRVVAAFSGGSEDVPDSINRVPMFTEGLRKGGVEIVDSIPALLERVDAILLTSVDGRKHLEQARPVIAAGKPLFIDKPVAGTLADAIEIFRLAAEKNVPCFSSSGLRYSPGIAGMVNNPAIGEILGCDAFGPCALEPHHPDLFWYGVHGVEALFTIMGTGCQTVSRTHTDDSDFVVGTWKDGRIGTFRGSRSGPHSYGAMVFGSKSITRSGDFGGYDPLVVEVAKFFRSGKPPVSAETTIELFAFMEAADESKRQDGKPIALQQVIDAARTASTQDAPKIASGVITPTQTIDLFSGHDLSNWYTWLPDDGPDDPRHLFVMQPDGTLRVSGDGFGGLITRHEYANYHLVMEYRWGTATWRGRKDSARDGGLLLHCQGPDGNFGGAAGKPGPWMTSIECQIIEGGVGDIVVLAGKDAQGQTLEAAVTCEIGRDRDGEAIWTPGGKKERFTKGRVNWFGRDPDWKDVVGFRGRDDVDSPGQEWTRLECFASGDTLVYRVNGTVVNRATEVVPAAGKIFIQTGGAEMFVRRLELNPLPKALP